MTPVKVALIGLGNMGQLHAKWLMRSEAFDLVAVADVDPARSALIASDGIRHFTSGRSLLRSKSLASEIEAVLIATPHYDHTSLGAMALKKGLHVLVEKPISVDKRDALRLINAHDPTKQIFAAMFNQRVHPAYGFLKSALDEETYGALRRFSWTITDWFRSQRYFDSGGWRATWRGEGGGVLLNQSPHQLDLLTWLFGMPSAVFASCGFGRWHAINVDDEVHAVLEYPSGVTGSFITSTGEAPGRNTLEIVCDHATLTLDLGQPLVVRRNAQSISQSITSNNPFEKPDCETEYKHFEGDGGQHRTILENFARAIRGEEPLIAPAIEGLASVELANAMLLSGGTRTRVILPLDDGRYRRWLNDQKRRESPKELSLNGKGTSEVSDLSGSFGS